MRTCTDLLLVHAGAVVTPSGSGVLLPAASGSGKTSLVAGLVRAGWGYLSDEVGAIDPVTRRLCPYPKVLSIKPGMFEGFVDLIDPDQGWPISSREWLIAPEVLRADPVADRSDVGLIVFLEHAPDVLRTSDIAQPCRIADRALRARLQPADLGAAGPHAPGGGRPERTELLAADRPTGRRCSLRARACRSRRVSERLVRTTCRPLTERDRGPCPRRS